MHEGITIRGLTTAASLWTTAGIGMAAGSGMVAVAMAGTVLVHLVLALMARLERRYFPHEATVLRLKAIDRPGLLGEVATEIGRFGLNIVATDVNVDREDATVTIEINISHENAKYVGRSPTPRSSNTCWPCLECFRLKWITGEAADASSAYR